jgi:hypothetical protein
MNSTFIYNYVLNLENKNNELITENNILIKKIDDFNDELNNFKKVSIMVNFNKQLKDKDNTIMFLENELKNIKLKQKEVDSYNKTNNKNDLINDTSKNNLINDTSKNDLINDTSKNDLINDTSKNDLINDTSKNNLINKVNIEEKQNVELKDIKIKKKKNRELIKYKNKEYFLNTETNEIYDISDKKLKNILGYLINGKIRFNK